MAKLLPVGQDHEYKRRQIPFEVDSMKMVLQFSDKCNDCGNSCKGKQRDFERFSKKFSTLTKDEIAVACLVSERDVMSLMSQLVPCVGCRKSAERLYRQLQKSQHPALEPLVITPRGELSVRYEYLLDGRSLFSLFHIHGNKLHGVVESIPKSKKNKRCNLHSLDTHKWRTLGCWLEAWDVLDDSCREKVLIVEMSCLLNAVESYLEKHKFCGECKSKVLLAYSILVGEQESDIEKGYCAALYENLRCCNEKKHIHVVNDTDFIAQLLEKAEPEFLEGKRDRHAKTLDVAQEEVLTCLGIHLFERIHSVWQKLRSEEQTWIILFYVGVSALKKSYHSALEDKQGATNLELLCQEFAEKEKREEEKRVLKREKKRMKKAKNGIVSKHEDSLKTPEPSISCSCSTEDIRPSNFNHLRNSNNDSNCNSLRLSLQDCNHRSSFSQSSNSSYVEQGKSTVPPWNDIDGDSCSSSSLQGSNEGSEEGFCSGCYTDTSDLCECENMLRSSPTRVARQTQCSNVNSQSGQPGRHSFQASQQPSLQDLLESLCAEEEEDPCISEEEILAFRARKGEVESKRQLLRETLRQRFKDFHMSRHINTL